MLIERSFQRTAGIAALLALPLAFGNTYTMLLAMDFNLEAVLDPLAVVASGPQAAELWRWSMVLDMLGYYLLIVPLTIVLWRWLGARGGAWGDLFALALLSYSVVGAAGAAIHAAVIPPLIHAHAAASEAQQAILQVVFLGAHDAVMYGLWNLLDALASAVGWLGFGVLLLRQRRAIGVATLVLGASALADGIGVIVGVEVLASAGLMMYLFLAPVWAAWLGLDLLRRPLRDEALLVERQAQTRARVAAEGGV